MQTSKPAENLLHRLLQSEKVRNTYQLILEDENGCTKILLRCLEIETGLPDKAIERSNPVLMKNFFRERKDFLC
jgi:hypothetical protein